MVYINNSEMKKNPQNCFIAKSHSNKAIIIIIEADNEMLPAWNYMNTSKNLTLKLKATNQLQG